MTINKFIQDFFVFDWLTILFKISKKSNGF